MVTFEFSYIRDEVSKTNLFEEMLRFKSELFTGFPVAETTLATAKVFEFIDTVFACVKFIDIDSSLYWGSKLESE